jgi:leucyl aminopeptidase (aminopeptidase T)
MDRTKLGARQAVEVCAGVKDGEQVIFLTDKPSSKVANYLIEVAVNLQASVTVLRVEDFGKRPIKIPQKVLNLISNSKVAFICSKYYASELASFWCPISQLVNKSKVRLIIMVDCDDKILSGGMCADYRKIRKFSNMVYQKIKNGQNIRVKTKLGSDLVIQLGYKWVILDGFPEPGKWVNLPDGEVLTTPKSVDGRIVIDGEIEEFDNPRFGLLKNYPITLTFKNGFAEKGSIDCKNKLLKGFLESKIFGDDGNAARVGEFAFGTNIFLRKLIGNLTQDEKFPSIHIAFGDPHGEMTGAKWTSTIHMDAIVLKPDVWVDDKMLMKEGKYLVDYD